MRRIILAVVLAMIPLAACAEEADNKEIGKYAHLTVDHYVRDIVNHPAFKVWVQRL
jgi:hypothetical protein